MIKRTVALFALSMSLSACGGAAPASSADASAGQAAASNNAELCTLGLAVLMPGGKPGTVTKVEGSGCTVTDEKGLESTFAEFMLEPAPGAAPPMELLPGAPKAGWYQCYGGPAGNFRFEIRNGNTYANADGASGSYTFDPATADITWTSGPWTDFYSRILKDGDIGVTMKPDRSFFGITCEHEG